MSNPISSVVKDVRRRISSINEQVKRSGSSINEAMKKSREQGKSAFKFSFKPDMPEAPAAAPQADLSGSLAQEELRRRQGRMRGRASTILTSTQGAASSGSIGTKTLLGG